MTKTLPWFVRPPKPVPPPEATGWLLGGGIDIHVDKGVWIDDVEGWKGWE